MSTKKVRPKPKPPSAKLSKRPPTPEVAAPAFNNVSEITSRQIARAEQAIDNLREEMKALRKSPPPVRVVTEQPTVTVELPPRPRIASVKIRYDQMGIPAEMVPVYQEV